jgi:hypothetical protein
MRNVVSFPLPAGELVTPDELARHLSEACAGLLLANGRLEAQLADAENERDAALSTSESRRRRLQLIHVRRAELVSAGAIAGIVLTLIFDGSLSRWFS